MCGEPSRAACSGTSQVPTPAFRPHFTSPNATQSGHADCQLKVGFRPDGHQFLNEVKTREGRIGNPHIPVRGRSAYVIIPYSIASLTAKHASAIQGKTRRGRIACAGNPHMQHVREPHRYLPRHSGRILRARGNRKSPPELKAAQTIC